MHVTSTTIFNLFIYFSAFTSEIMETTVSIEAIASIQINTSIQISMTIPFVASLKIAEQNEGNWSIKLKDVLTNFTKNKRAKAVVNTYSKKKQKKTFRLITYVVISP